MSSETIGSIRLRTKKMLMKTNNMTCHNLIFPFIIDRI